jgi:hypothetical protein
LKITRHAQLHTRLLKDDAIKVSKMAKSISEGTLKTQQKKDGEAVEGHNTALII